MKSQIRGVQIKYILIALINVIYGALLLATLTTDTPGFLVVLIIGTALTLIGLTGIILWLIHVLKGKTHANTTEPALKSWFSLVKSFDIVLVIGLFFRALVIQPFVVDGVSMETNFHDKEALLVDKISYHFDNIKRGDVIIFVAPKSPQDDYIKRVIGLPGETVSITSNQVFINGRLLSEPYLTPGTQTLTNQDNNFSITLAADQYFVMGDNRSNSSDSRDWGPVPSQNIIGRAWLIVYPWNDKGIVKNPKISL